MQTDKRFLTEGTEPDIALAVLLYRTYPAAFKVFCKFVFGLLIVLVKYDKSCIGSDVKHIVLHAGGIYDNLLKSGLSGNIRELVCHYLHKTLTG